MASPQLENGFLRIANEIAEALMKTKLSANQSKILWAIFRKTYGYNKKEDWISISQFKTLTGIREQHVSRTLKELLERKIISKSKHEVSFNKDYTQWIELPKKVKVTDSGKEVTNSGEHNIQLDKRKKIGSQNSKEFRDVYLSFEEYESIYPVDEYTSIGINYFLKKYQQEKGTEHRHLRKEQWDSVVKTFLEWYDDELDQHFTLIVEQLQEMINSYLKNRFKKGCDYSILHFNHPNIKLNRIYNCGLYEQVISNCTNVKTSRENTIFQETSIGV